MKLLRLWEQFRKLEPGLDEPTADLPSVQILETGKFGNTNVGEVEFSESDLDTIAANYNAGKHDAPITLDHARQGPAYGWVKRGTVKREGSALFGYIESIPVSLIEAIKNKRYSKRSAEIAPYDKPSKSLTAVSFLGAAPPVIKGMKEITLSSDESSAIVDWADATACFADSSAAFSEIPIPAIDPAPTSHGALCCQSRSDEMLGHFHECYMDGEGNGFSGPPIHFNEMYEIVALTGDTHTHLVSGGSLAVANHGDIAHIHPLTTFKTSTTPAGEGPQSEALNMAEKTETKPAIEAGQVAENAVDLAEIQAQIKALQAENAGLKAGNATMQRERAEEKATALFSETFQRALVQGRVSVGEKDALKAFYDTLPLKEENGALCLGEAALETKRAYLATILARPAVHEKLTKLVTLSEDGKESYTQAREIENGQDFRTRRSELAFKKIAEAEAKGQKLEMSEAICLAEREMKGAVRT